MSQDAVANRYALALFQLAEEKGQVEETEQQLRVVQQVMEENVQFQELLKHPKVTAEKKKEMFAEAFKGSASETVMNTLYVLVDQRRESILVDMIDEFKSLANEASGVADAKVYSVKALSEAEIEALSESFAKQVGKKALRVENIVDPDLIGGLRIRIGDRIFDGSVKGQLQKLERQLVSGNVRR